MHDLSRSVLKDGKCVAGEQQEVQDAALKVADGGGVLNGIRTTLRVAAHTSMAPFLVCAFITTNEIMVQLTDQPAHQGAVIPELGVVSLCNDEQRVLCLQWL